MSCLPSDAKKTRLTSKIKIVIISQDTLPIYYGTIVDFSLPQIKTTW